MIDGSKGNGLDVKRVSWAPNATDLVGPVTAAGGQTADAILTTSDAKGCVNLSKSLEKLKIDTPVASQPLCLNPQVAKALGGIPAWYYGIASTLATDASDPAATAFMKVATKYGRAKEGAADVWVPVVFGQTLTIAQRLNRIGADNITDQTVAEQAKAFKGSLALGHRRSSAASTRTARRSAATRRSSTSTRARATSRRLRAGSPRPDDRSLTGRVIVARAAIARRAVSPLVDSDHARRRRSARHVEGARVDLVVSGFGEIGRALDGGAAVFDAPAVGAPLHDDLVADLGLVGVEAGVGGTSRNQ